jgi:glutamyl-tRNA synthetase
VFEDLVAGRRGQDVAAAIGDFVVRRADGVASYQLAVVVDDALSGITHVLRGEDLLDSTPRQLLLFEALGKPPPRFAHVPLVVGDDGKRLAKREGAMSITDLREKGVPRERVISLLARWSGLSEQAGEPAELVSSFSLSGLGTAAIRINEDEVSKMLRV